VCAATLGLAATLYAGAAHFLHFIHAALGWLIFARCSGSTGRVGL
jgi:hypothetical protein